MAFGSLTPLQQQQVGLKGAVNQQAMNLLKNSGNQFNFEPIAQKAKTQFQTQTVPGLAERFTSLGGGQRSSAFQGALGQAGANLNEGLASLEQQFGLKQQGLNQNLLRLLLTHGLGKNPTEEQSYGQELINNPQFIAMIQSILSGENNNEIDSLNNNNGFLSNYAPGILSILGSALGGFFGGPGGLAAGGAAGNAAGRGLASLFS